MKDLAPRNRDLSPGYASPFFMLRREMDRLFDDAFRVGAPGQAWPQVEMTERDKDVVVSAELPGLDQKDIDVSVDDDVLILCGEKRSEHNEQDRHFSERFYGRFERRLQLPTDVDEANVKATYKDGVLTVTLPKSSDSQRGAKHIQINS